MVSPFPTQSPSRVQLPSAYAIFPDEARKAWMEGLIDKIQRGLHPSPSPPPRSPSPLRVTEELRPSPIPDDRVDHMQRSDTPSSVDKSVDKNLGDFPGQDAGVSERGDANQGGSQPSGYDQEDEDPLIRDADILMEAGGEEEGFEEEDEDTNDGSEENSDGSDDISSVQYIESSDDEDQEATREEESIDEDEFVWEEYTSDVHGPRTSAYEDEEEEEGGDEEEEEEEEEEGEEEEEEEAEEKAREFNEEENLQGALEVKNEDRPYGLARISAGTIQELASQETDTGSVDERQAFQPPSSMAMMDTANTSTTYTSLYPSLPVPEGLQTTSPYASPIYPSIPALPADLSASPHEAASTADIFFDNSMIDPTLLTELAQEAAALQPMFHGIGDGGARADERGPQVLDGRITSPAEWTGQSSRSLNPADRLHDKEILFVEDDSDVEGDMDDAVGNEDHEEVGSISDDEETDDDEAGAREEDELQDSQSGEENEEEEEEDEDGDEDECIKEIHGDESPRSPILVSDSSDDDESEKRSGTEDDESPTLLNVLSRTSSHELEVVDNTREREHRNHEENSEDTSSPREQPVSAPLLRMSVEEHYSVKTTDPIDTLGIPKVEQDMLVDFLPKILPSPSPIMINDSTVEGVPDISWAPPAPLVLHTSEEDAPELEEPLEEPLETSHSAEAALLSQVSVTPQNPMKAPMESATAPTIDVGMKHLSEGSSSPAFATDLEADFDRATDTLSLHTHAVKVPISFQEEQTRVVIKDRVEVDDKQDIVFERKDSPPLPPSPTRTLVDFQAPTPAEAIGTSPIGPPCPPPPLHPLIIDATPEYPAHIVQSPGVSTGFLNLQKTPTDTRAPTALSPNLPSGWELSMPIGETDRSSHEPALSYQSLDDRAAEVDEPLEDEEVTEPGGMPIPIWPDQLDKVMRRSGPSQEPELDTKQVGEHSDVALEDDTLPEGLAVILEDEAMPLDVRASEEGDVIVSETGTIEDPIVGETATSSAFEGVREIIDVDDSDEPSSPRTASPLLRHHHGSVPPPSLPPSPTVSSVPLRLTQRRGRPSVSPSGHLPVTRSHCFYRKLRLSAQELTAVVLAPQCVLADTDRLQEEGCHAMGVPTSSQQRRGMEAPITESTPRLHPLLATQLHRLVGTKVFAGGDCFLLEAGPNALAEDSHETHRTISMSNTPRRPRTSVTTVTSAHDDGDEQAPPNDSVPSGPIDAATPPMTRRRARLSAFGTSRSSVSTDREQRSASVVNAVGQNPPATPSALPSELKEPGQGPSMGTRSQKRKLARATSIIHSDAGTETSQISGPDVSPTALLGTQGRTKRRRFRRSTSVLSGTGIPAALVPAPQGTSSQVGEKQDRVEVTITSVGKRKGLPSALEREEGSDWRDLDTDGEEDEEDDNVQDMPIVRTTRSMAKKQRASPSEVKSEVGEHGKKPRSKGKHGVEGDEDEKMEMDVKQTPPSRKSGRSWSNLFGLRSKK
ncbi:hypothetical protein M231_07632 [Tremella mesenterica]|uniref:Uncharacterized protein n=1 Tax=Tremella mesenterica TaxID=5217 RepID=A0A4Q1BDV9_TREME|nr:hypothetical protein M231_07632 [Tremella mesenterica]